MVKEINIVNAGKVPNRAKKMHDPTSSDVFCNDLNQTVSDTEVGNAGKESDPSKYMHDHTSSSRNGCSGNKDISPMDYVLTILDKVSVVAKQPKHTYSLLLHWAIMLCVNSQECLKSL